MANDIKTYLLQTISAHPKDVVKLAMERFDVSRPAIHRHLNELINSGEVIKTGSRNKTRYTLSRPSAENRYRYVVGMEGEAEIWKRDIAPHLVDLPENVRRICEHGFTEMFNNVIDHSESKSAIVDIKVDARAITLIVFDLGIGIFKKIALACGYQDYRESIPKLQQGKFTTDSTKHSGEGIFFTSRIFDSFSLSANNLSYIKDNTEDDWFFQTLHEEEEEGTLVTLVIDKNSTRNLREVFSKYTNPESFKFDRTHILISLAKFEEDQFISRSQAKRLFHQLGNFSEVILDFAGVTFVGQAFVDEIFGVFAAGHPNVSFFIQNANDDIQFMIKRGVANREEVTNKVRFV